MKNFLIIFLFLFFTSCSMVGYSDISRESDSASARRKNKREWTFVIYMAADNELEGFAIQDLNELEAGIPNKSDCTYLVLLDRADGFDGTNGDWTGTRLYEVTKDPDGMNGIIVSKELSSRDLDLTCGKETELDMGNPYTLKALLDFSKREYPSEKRGLVIWGHGAGWKGYAFDDFTNNHLTLNSLQKAINGNRQDLIVFDTCFGLTAESIYQLRNECDFIIGTKGVNGSSGIDYENFAKKSYGIIDPFMMAQLIQNCISGAGIVNTVFIEESIKEFDSLSKNISEYINSVDKRNEIKDILFNKTENYYCSSFPCDLYIDAESFCRHLMNLPDEKIKTGAENVLSKIEDSGGFSLYLISMISSSMTATGHDEGYKKRKNNGDENEKCSFVTDTQFWVPTGEGQSLLDSLFYKVF